ncbi:MAG: phosphate transport system regulatory protein PhoU [Zetaproteobacteria bacterium]|nr:MAG: phosphate transport system regulatory protein PhoU [Zetaproteobacteria bacterium]
MEGGAAQCDTMNRHTFSAFDDDLRDIHDDILTMMKLARRNSKRAINALLNGQKEKARRVIDADEVVDALELQIDRKARMIIVHHQPVASDLRTVFTTMKITTELERISDLATCIARMALEEEPDPVTDELMIMKPLLFNMFRLALQAFKASDAAIAAQLIAYDRHLNESCHAIDRVLHSMMVEDPARTERCIAVANVAKRIERIGDHLKNIGQMIVYQVSGREARHVDPKMLEALLCGDDEDEEG